MRKDNEDRGLKLENGKLTFEFKGLSVDNETDLQKLLTAISPLAAKAAFDARKNGKRDWSVGGSVTTTSGGTSATVSGTYGGKDYSVSASGSTSVGGATVTGTVSSGTQGTSGTV